MFHIHHAENILPGDEVTVIDQRDPELPRRPIKGYAHLSEGMLRVYEVPSPADPGCSGWYGPSGLRSAPIHTDDAGYLPEGVELVRAVRVDRPVYWESDVLMVSRPMRNGRERTLRLGQTIPLYSLRSGLAVPWSGCAHLHKSRAAAVRCATRTAAAEGSAR